MFPPTENNFQLMVAGVNRMQNFSRVFHATTKCFWTMKNLHSAGKSTACSPETAQTMTISIPRWNKPPSPHWAKGSPLTQALCQQRNSGVQGCSLPARLSRHRGITTGTEGVSRAWISHGCAPLGLGFDSSKVTLCSSAPSNLLCYWGKMKFRAAPFCFQLIEMKPEGWKPNEANANKTFCINIFVSS